MANDRPTASVSGRDGWEWKQRAREQRTRESEEPSRTDGPNSSAEQQFRHESGAKPTTETRSSSGDQPRSEQPTVALSRDATSKAESASTGPPTSKLGRHRSRPPRPALHERIKSLESELERTQRHLQEVVSQYERILTEKNRELSDDDSNPEADSTHGSTSEVIASIFR